VLPLHENLAKAWPVTSLAGWLTVSVFFEHSLTVCAHYVTSKPACRLLFIRGPYYSQSLVDGLMQVLVNLYVSTFV